MLYKLYRALTSAAAPGVRLWLRRRTRKGKEDPARFEERFGKASLPRPQGALLWCHAASVGEMVSVLPLLSALLEKHAHLHVLLTTGTVTSAQLAAARLPRRALHQFVPVDTPAAVAAFLRHWRPDVALWVESELWPNLLVQAHAAGVPLALLNARMSARSFRQWRRLPALARRLLSCFALVLPQSAGDGERLAALGAAPMELLGNIKFEAPRLPADETELARLKEVTAGRPLWLAASTHPGEEAEAARIHAALKNAYPALLTVIAPRHASRGEELAKAFRAQGLLVAQRSHKQALTPETDIYLADTMGELGLLYRLADVAFIGGSLVPHGGQNPLEAARLTCALICGPYTDNFKEICLVLESENALLRVRDGNGLERTLAALLADRARAAALAEAAYAAVESRQGVTEKILRRLEPFIPAAREEKERGHDASAHA